MPLYEYCCQQCGKKIEKIQKFSDEPLTTCEDCGGRLEKLLSAPSIRFKGSGWYISDYAGKKSDEGGDEKSQESPAGKDKKDLKSESSSTKEKKASSNKPKVA